MHIVSIASLWEIRNKGHLGYLENKERKINLHKMVRTPCCEKMGMKKGPWTPEEDHILVSYIQHYGHENWRALPKQAGLMRCGKSCRLRWINYLRPDIKRGNFTKEEEETIVKLHQLLGNRWAAIAAKLPGRTDNEIKNFWHTHLKKKLLRSSSTNLSINSNTANYHKHYSNNYNNINGVLSKYPINNLMFNISNSTASSVSIQSMEISHHDQEHPPTKISTVREDATWNFWYNLYVKSSGETSRVLVNEDHS